MTFPDPKIGKAVPYGVYDIGANAGWVLVGADGDTAAFAVQALRRWWDSMGSKAYPDANKLLICADAGGSNSYRTRLWKTERPFSAGDRLPGIWWPACPSRS